MQGFGQSTLLVAGGAGFIGSNFIRLVLATHPKTTIVCVDALTYAGSRDNLQGLPQGRFVFIRGDITDKAHMARVVKKYAPEYVINFAAESHVDRSIHGGAETFVRTNVLGVSVLLDVLRAALGVKKFVQVSTDEVYGALPLKSKHKFTERSPLAPNSPYAASKAAGDLVARSFYATYNLPVVITRCSNNYGPFQHPEKLIPFSVTRLMEGKPIAIYGDGQYVRDWIHVDDHSAALVLALLNGVPGEVYNIGASDEMSNLSLAHQLLALCKKDSSALAFVADRPGHDRRYAIEASKIKRALGWKPKHRLKAALAPTVAWYIENALWVTRALAHAGEANAHIKK